MKGTPICPVCGQPTLKVKEKAVKHQLASPNDIAQKEGKWQVCVNENCDTVYIQNDIRIQNKELKQPIYFKDKTDESMICYCYKITKGEINVALENGCNSVGEVYKYLKKSKSGSCSTNNPLGKSCSNVFKYTVEQLKAAKSVIE